MSQAIDKPRESGENTGERGAAQFGAANSAASGLPERIRMAVKAAGGYSAVADRPGLPGRTLSRLLAGQEPKMSHILDLAAATSVRFEWLAIGSGPMRAEGSGFAEDAGIYPFIVPRPAPIDDVLISRYDARTAAVLGTPEEGRYPIQKVLISGDFIRGKLQRKPEQLALIECIGDSMEPALLDGDELLVDITATQPRSGPIYILRVGGALMAKRIQPRMDGTVMILSDNPRYPPEVITPSDATPLDVVGEVLWRSGTLR